MKGKRLSETINMEAFLADLGKMPDSVIARKYSIFYRTVMQHRNKLGIKRYSEERIPDGEQFAEDVKIYPNTGLVEKYGVGLRTISKWRKKLGLANICSIDVLQKNKFIEDCKNMRGKQLSSKYGVGKSTIARWKEDFGLTTGKKEDRKITWLVDVNGCWVCASHKVTSGGYPQCSVGRKDRLVAKVMWMEKNKQKWPKSLIMIHSCDNRLCINPNHISPGTSKENGEQMAKRDRSPWGWRCGARKLTPEQAKEIYALKNSGLSQRKVGEIFNVNGATVWYIWNGVTWWRDNEGIENSPVFLNKSRKLFGRKLTLQEVESIRSMKGLYTATKVGEMFNVTRWMISKIWDNKSWKVIGQ